LHFYSILITHFFKTNLRKIPSLSARVQVHIISKCEHCKERMRKPEKGEMDMDAYDNFTFQTNREVDQKTA
jgi:hypothetical protein